MTDNKKNSQIIQQEFKEALTKVIRNSKGQNKDAFLQLIQQAQSTVNQKQAYLMIEELFQSFPKPLPNLNETETLQIIKNCKTLSTLAHLYTKNEICMRKTNSSDIFQEKSLKQKSAKIREKIRDFLEDMNDHSELFFFKKCKACTQFSQWEPYSILIKYICNLLIDFGHDSFQFGQIIDLLLKALLLTANNKTIGNDQYIHQLIDNFIEFLIDSRNLYYWLTVFECTIYALQIDENSNDIIQPNLVARLLFSKIPYVSDIYQYIGRYLINSINITNQMLMNLFKYGPIPQYIELLACILHDFQYRDNRQFIIDNRQQLLEKLSLFLYTPDMLLYIIDCLEFLIIGPSQLKIDIEPIKQIMNKIIISLVDIIKPNKSVNNKLKKQEYNEYDQFKLDYTKEEEKQIYSFLQKLTQIYPKKFDAFNEYQIEQQSQASRIIYSWNDKPKSEFQPKFVGIKNLMNTCYLNSLIQALFMSKIFRNYILSLPKIGTIDYLFGTLTLQQALRNCFVFLSSIDKSLVEYVPIQFKRSLRVPYKNQVDQQDVGEFAAHLFEDLESEMKQDYAKIKDIFVGQQRSEFKCQRCNTILLGPEEEFLQQTLNFDYSNQSSIYSQNYKIDSIKEMINRQREEERMEFKCEKCKTQVKGNKHISYSRTPKVLIVVLNRFLFNRNIQEKIKKSVRLDEEIIFQEKNKNVKYQLYAFINHYGPSADAGHYTTYASIPGGWIQFDDNRVEEYSYKHVSDVIDKFQYLKDSTPYILFYERID